MIHQAKLAVFGVSNLSDYRLSCLAEDGDSHDIILEFVDVTSFQH